jgi:sigma-70-like protein
VMLERLSPVERAVFLLREVFAYPYDEIARILERSEDNCRQLLARARRHVDAHRPRFAVSAERQEELTERFLQAAQTGDADALVGMLAADAVAYTDGGGKVRAAPRPIVGREKVARFIAVTAQRGIAELAIEARPVAVNGRPGRVLRAADGAVYAVLVLDVSDDGIHAVHLVANPEKLRHLT